MADVRRFIVIAPSERRDALPLIEALAAVPGIAVLSVSPPDTALVEMTDEARVALERQHPTLIIEPDTYYELV